jgi:hypothetical protein
MMTYAEGRTVSSGVGTGEDDLASPLEQSGQNADAFKGARHQASGVHGALGVQRPLTGGPGRRERSLTSGPLSILFHNEIKLLEIELTAGK